MADFDRSENHLLGLLSPSDFALIEPNLIAVDMAKGERFVRPDDVVRSSWFPLGGIVSVVASTAGGDLAEVGIVGREGMVAVATLHGVDRGMMEVFCQLRGRAARMPANALIAAMAASSSLQRILLAYAYSFAVQTANAALAYAVRPIEARLARWLLMTLDRIDGDAIGMTHEAFALMLGVRRAGVTVAMQGLEAKGAITARRAEVVCIDRARLTEIAGDAYGISEATYARLLGIAVAAPARAAALRPPAIPANPRSNGHLPRI